MRAWVMRWRVMGGTGNAEATARDLAAVCRDGCVM